MKRKSMVKWLSFALTLCLAFASVNLIGISVSAAGFSGSGKGTAKNPYLVTTAAQLDEMRNNLSATYKLANNIDMSQIASFTPIPTALTAGASVRIADVKNGGGIRFESKVNTDLYNSLKNTEGVTVSLGTIIVPEEYRNGLDINFDNFKTASQGGTNEAKNLCVDIPQTKWQDEANGIYTAALINLKEANYTKSFAARGYMKVTYADGTEEYFYSDFDADGNVRSIQAVASAALADTSVTYTEAQKAILKVFAGQS